MAFASQELPTSLTNRCLKGMVGLVRLELTTSRLSSARSNQLSYKPGTRDPTLLLYTRNLVEADGIEPTTLCLQSRCSPS